MIAVTKKGETTTSQKYNQSSIVPTELCCSAKILKICWRTLIQKTNNACVELEASTTLVLRPMCRLTDTAAVPH